MPRLPWGFTNTTTAAGGIVTKRYEGPNAELRRAAEYAFFVGLQGVLPVPPVVSTVTDDELRTVRLPGVPGSEVIESGDTGWVFHAAGSLLRVLAQNAHLLPGEGPAAVHGDFGPQNLLVDTAKRQITALVDAEWAGRASDDLRHLDAAWFEWIIRFHHPHLTPHLPAFYAGYAQLPPWSVRHELMLHRCADMLDFAVRRDAASAARWRDRIAATHGFGP